MRHKCLKVLQRAKQIQPTIMEKKPRCPTLPIVYLRIKLCNSNRDLRVATSEKLWRWELLNMNSSSRMITEHKDFVSGITLGYRIHARTRHIDSAWSTLWSQTRHIVRVWDHLFTLLWTLIKIRSAGKETASILLISKQVEWRSSLRIRIHLSLREHRTSLQARS